MSLFYGIEEKIVIPQLFVYDIIYLTNELFDKSEFLTVCGSTITVKCIS